MVGVALVTALIGIQLLVHREEGSWQAKGAPRDTVTVDGHLLEWEWTHVGETIQLFDAVGESPPRISSQNLYRMLGAYVMSLLRKPLGSIYAVAVGSTVIFWVIAAVSLYGLAPLAAGSTEVGIAAAVLVATAPGFVGYLGNVDPHPAGYAAAAAWLFVVERWKLLSGGPVNSVRPPWWSGPTLAGLLLCAASWSIEIGYPLLLAAWGGYSLIALGSRTSLAATTARLGLMTAVFAAGYYGLRALAEHVLFEEVIAMNEPHAHLIGSLGRIGETGLVKWLADQWPEQPERWLAAFPPVVTLYAGVGWFAVDTRWRLWAGSVIGSFVVAVLLTKPATRTFYLAYPAVYVLAACGMGYLGRVIASHRAISGHEDARRIVRWGVMGALALAVLMTTNADLWGDYRIPIRWYGSQ